jgi:hypothetical protein
MMMQMLHAGGAKVFTDGQREADKSNPKGYFEHEGIKQLGRNKRLILQAKDQVAKVVAPQLKFLPPAARYKIVFMNRKVEEVVASQQKMSGRHEDRFPLHLVNFYRKQIEEIHSGIFTQVHVDYLEIDYHEAVKQPEAAAKKVAAFLPELKLDVAAMSEAVDPELYRNRMQKQKSEN